MNSGLSLLYSPDRPELRPLDDARAQDLIEQFTSLIGEPPFSFDDEGGCVIHTAIWANWKKTDATRDEFLRLWMWVGARQITLSTEDVGHG